MSQERYDDLVRMGAPRLDDGLRYRVARGVESDDLFVSIERSKTVKGLFGRERVAWKTVSGPFQVEYRAYLWNGEEGQTEWERSLAKVATYAAERMRIDNLRQTMTDKWVGGHP